MKEKIFSLFILLVISFACYAQDGKLVGKSIGVIGDSYVKNHKDPIEYTWHYKFAKKQKMEYHNFGRNGNCISFDHPRFGEAMYKRYTTMPDSLDYIIVIAGHNDTAILDSIGGIDVFKERMSILCEGLVNKYPAANIFFFTRWTCENFSGSNAEKIIDAMIEVCGYYSIPIFDAARKGGMFAGNESFRTLYFQRRSDNAHLNANGHTRFLKVAENFILQY